MKALALTPSAPFHAPADGALHRLARRVRAWPLALWQAACRYAERADRFVPYY